MSGFCSAHQGHDPACGICTAGVVGLGTMGDYRYLPCPTCGATNGRRCKTPRGAIARATHIARRRAVEALWPKSAKASEGGRDERA